MRTVTLNYLGTGTVRVEGAGEVSFGGQIDLPEDVAAALVEQQPAQWAFAGASAPDGAVFEGALSPASPVGRPEPAGGE